MRGCCPHSVRAMACVLGRPPVCHMLHSSALLPAGLENIRTMSFPFLCLYSSAAGTSPLLLHPPRSPWSCHLPNVRDCHSHRSGRTSLAHLSHRRASKPQWDPQPRPCSQRLGGHTPASSLRPVQLQLQEPTARPGTQLLVTLTAHLQVEDARPRQQFCSLCHSAPLHRAPNPFPPFSWRHRLWGETTCASQGGHLCVHPAQTAQLRSVSQASASLGLAGPPVLQGAALSAVAGAAGARAGPPGLEPVRHATP